MPTVDAAVRRLTYELEHSRVTGAAALKLIHGYGSSGHGGRIRVEARKYLERQKKLRKFHDFITGETFSIFNPATLDAFRRCGELRRDPDLERHNNGVTFIIF